MPASARAPMAAWSPRTAESPRRRKSTRRPGSASSRAGWRATSETGSSQGGSARALPSRRRASRSSTPWSRISPPKRRLEPAAAPPQSVPKLRPTKHKWDAGSFMKRWLAKPRARRLARVLLAAAGLTGTGLGPAPAQWLGPLPEAPIPPGAIVRSLMNRGFAEIGRPGLSGEVYVVDGINSRGMRLRLVIDAYDGNLVSRTRLDAPMLPPAEVGRGRVARAEPFGEYHGPSFDDEAIAPRRWQGPPVDRDALPPPPGASSRPSPSRRLSSRAGPAGRRRRSLQRPSAKPESRTALRQSRSRPTPQRCRRHQPCRSRRRSPKR